MPRQRSPENRGLPERWRKKPSGYYYQVPPGLEHKWDGKKTFKLGKTLPAAYKEWAARLETLSSARKISELLTRYSQEVMPTKSASSRSREASCLKNITAAFGKMELLDIKPRHIYAYFDKRKTSIKKSNGSTTARLELALLSHAYSKAVEWGYIDNHPFKGEVKLQGTKPRERYIEDWEIRECLALSCPSKRGGVAVIQAYIFLKLLTGLRQGDILRLKETNLKPDGLHSTTRKTGKAVIYEWSDELQMAVEMVKAARPVDISPFLFCSRNGEGYFDEEKGTASGWNSMWQRFMTRVLAETKVKDRFTEHDLRAKCASDAISLEHARSLLAHTDSVTTQRIYRRKPEVIKPAKTNLNSTTRNL